MRRRIINERTHQRARDGLLLTDADIHRPALFSAIDVAEVPVHRVHHRVRARVFGVVCEVERAVRGNRRETIRKPAPGGAA